MKHMEDRSFENLIEDFVSREEYRPQTPPRVFLALVKPAVNRKSSELRKNHRKRMENIQLCIGYLIFSIVAPLLVFDYMVNGLTETTVFTAVVIGIVSFMSLCCLPLLLKYNENN